MNETFYPYATGQYQYSPELFIFLGICLLIAGAILFVVNRYLPEGEAA